MYVCHTIAYEVCDLKSSLLVCMYIFKKSRSGTYIKVIGSETKTVCTSHTDGLPLSKSSLVIDYKEISGARSKIGFVWRLFPFHFFSFSLSPPFPLSPFPSLPSLCSHISFIPLSNPSPLPFLILSLNPARRSGECCKLTLQVRCQTLSGAF